MQKIIAFLTFFFLSCSEEIDYKNIETESKVVVEGSILEGDFAQVILMRSVPINTDVDSESIKDYLIRSAKVTVSDGEKEEVLRVKSDTTQIIPYVYYGEEIMGQKGKTYTLTINYLNRTLTSSTTIPESVPIKELSYVQPNKQNNRYYITLAFQNATNQINYYQILTRLDKKETYFVPAFYGNLDSSLFASEHVFMQINRGFSFFFKNQYKPYFERGNKVYVKLQTMNKDAFDFWNSWQNEVVNGKNPIFPANTSLNTNIKGGIGIWAGYGQSVASVKIN